MQDVMVGAIIGGAIALISGTIVAVIQARSSRGNIKLQFEQQENGFRIRRLIDIRAEYLKPLTKEAQKCSSISMEALGTARMINDGFKQTQTVSDDYRQDVTELDKLVDDMSESVTELQSYRAVVSDVTLRELLDNVMGTCIDVHKAMEPIRKAIGAEGGDKQSSLDFPKDNYDFLTKTLPKIPEHLRQINERIEKLLSGIE